jgi:hypothetical protein
LRPPKTWHHYLSSMLLRGVISSLYICYLKNKKMSESFIIPDETIIGKIYQLRNKSVMLDRDLAELYGVKAYRLREQVKRNINRFPENFMFTSGATSWSTY